MEGSQLKFDMNFKLIKKLTAAFPALIILILTNLVICLYLSVNLLNDFINAGFNKNIALFLSILICGFVYAFIALNHKLRFFINSYGESFNE